jgi:hypothetical protein
MVQVPAHLWRVKLGQFLTEGHGFSRAKDSPPHAVVPTAATSAEWRGPLSSRIHPRPTIFRVILTLLTQSQEEKPGTASDLY